MVKNRNKESDEENNYVSLEGSTKNQKARTIELNKEAKYILQKIKYSRDSSLPDEFIVTTKTGKINTASNLEHRMKVIMKNAELQGVKGGLHIFRKTFATRMYESGARVEEIAAYIGDLESTTQKYYIAIRKKVVSNGEVRQVVKLPGIKEETTVAKIDACGNIKIEEVEDMLAGDDDYGTANRYSPDNRTGGRQSTI